MLFDSVLPTDPYHQPLFIKYVVQMFFHDIFNLKIKISSGSQVGLHNAKIFMGEQRGMLALLVFTFVGIYQYWSIPALMLEDEIERIIRLFFCILFRFYSSEKRKFCRIICLISKSIKKLDSRFNGWKYFSLVILTFEIHQLLG